MSLKAPTAARISEGPFKTSGSARGSRPRRSAASAKRRIGFASLRAKIYAIGAMAIAESTNHKAITRCQGPALGGSGGGSAKGLLDLGQAVEVGQGRRQVEDQQQADHLGRHQG